MAFAPSAPAQTLSISTVDHAREPATLFEGMLEKVRSSANDERKSRTIRLRCDVSSSLTAFPKSRSAPQIVTIRARISTRHSFPNFGVSTRHSVTSRFRFNSRVSNHLIFYTRHLFGTLVTRHSIAETGMPWRGKTIQSHYNVTALRASVRRRSA